MHQLICDACQLGELLGLLSRNVLETLQILVEINFIDAYPTIEGLAWIKEVCDRFFRPESAIQVQDFRPITILLKLAVTKDKYSLMIAFEWLLDQFLHRLDLLVLLTTPTFKSAPSLKGNGLLGLITLVSSYLDLIALISSLLLFIWQVLGGHSFTCARYLLLQVSPLICRLRPNRVSMSGLWLTLSKIMSVTFLAYGNIHGHIVTQR